MFAGPVARLRSLWRGIRKRPDVEADMTEEFRSHVELRTQDLVARGVSPETAKRQATLEFGSTEQFKHEGRSSRGLRRIDDLRVSWLDFKLGFRMLARYPGLTLVGGLAMAFAIWIGAGTFELAKQIIRPDIPLPDGGRIIAIRSWDLAANRPEPQVGHDYVAWRSELTTLRDVGAYRPVERNLIIGQGRGEPVEIAEITASAFRLVRVPPLMGRGLVEADERPGAQPVVVIGYDAWQRRFAADPNVVGRVVRLGSSPVMVVGVMPQSFEFPVTQSFWIPLRLDVNEFGRREGPALRVFGRLAPDASLAEAQAELSALGARLSREFKDTHEHLRPQVMRYSRSVVDVSGWRSVGVMSVNLPIGLLLVLIVGNVALLMFARAATRESEIVVRTALGAGRARIIMQLFAEALVLGGCAAVVGLAAAGAGLRWVMNVVEVEFLNGGRLPFWFQDKLSPTTLLYALVLTVMCAVVAGVVPALKVTRAIGTRLKQSSAGSGGLRFGGVWTAVIVAQVAVTIAFPAIAFFVRRDAVQIESTDVGFPTHEFLSVRLEMDREPPPGAPQDSSAAAFRARFQKTYQELERRLAAEPAVSRVVFANLLPLMYHPHRIVELDEGGAAPLNPQWPNGYRISAASVAPGFLEAVNAPILAGRGFRASDHAIDLGEPGTVEARGGSVIVNQSFVRLVLGGRNPIGRRVRYVELEEWAGPVAEGRKPAAWYEIIGVVRDVGMAVGADVGQESGGDPKVAGMYHVVAPGAVYPAHVGIQVAGDATAFGPRLRSIATDIDPTLRLYKVIPLSDVTESELQFLNFWFRLILGVSAIALTLSLAGIYSVMSFTVARRTREIGVRVALGASARRVALAIFRRPLTQVSLGVLGGAAIVAFFARAILGVPNAKEIAFMVGYVVLMLAVCLLACIVPTRRALRIQPTEALRAED